MTTPEFCRSYLVHSRFSTRGNAKIAVCLQAICDGVYDFILNPSKPLPTGENVWDRSDDPALAVLQIRYLCYTRTDGKVRPYWLLVRDPDGSNSTDYNFFSVLRFVMVSHQNMICRLGMCTQSSALTYIVARLFYQTGLYSRGSANGLCPKVSQRPPAVSER